MKNPTHENLMYIGKSNKRFTHNRIYYFRRYVGSYYIIEDNRNSQRRIEQDYLEDNFKIITDKELMQFNRKLKLDKINVNIKS